MNLHKLATHTGGSNTQYTSLDPTSSPPSSLQRDGSLSLQQSNDGRSNTQGSTAVATNSGSSKSSSRESLLASQHSMAENHVASSYSPGVIGTSSLPDIQMTKATDEAMNTPLTIPHISSAAGHSKNSAAAETGCPARPPVQLVGRKDDTPKALTQTVANKLRPLLPVQQRLAKNWRLVYSIDQHGFSIHTMLDLCANEKAILLAIKDTKGKVFGAYLNEPIRLSPSFYGQGTCFLWKAYRSSPESRRKDAIKSFKYTGGNEYFILCDPDFVAVGGGRGKFGLWFKSDFLHGYSARCPTFNNEPLCLDPSSPKNADIDAQQEFVVAHLEIWAFDST
ncbi:oxidation resistance protein 1 [Coemansia sp. RSA 2049]|nr:oxidation resistance protein 1 [Coemansia sp. RSA 2049]